MSKLSVKEKVLENKKESIDFKSIAHYAIQFVFVFLLARTSIFSQITPFAASAYLAAGGGIYAFIGGVLGSYTIGSLENICGVVLVALMGYMLKDQKFHIWHILIGLICLYTVTILRSDFVPYDIILKIVSVTVSGLGYFVLKKAYKAQFIKSTSLKFSKNEAYASMFLLFALISGIKSENIIWLININDIMKFYLISAAAYYFGIGGGAATGAILGMLTGYNFEYSSLSMSLYTIFGFFTGIFAKFSKITALLGLLFSYLFAVMYLSGAANVVDYKDVIIAAVLFLITPNRLIKPYIERYTKGETAKDMVSTINSITASRLEKLANSFSGLSAEITKTQKSISSLSEVNANSLFDFLGERVCQRCTLKTICWKNEYQTTVESLTKAVNYLSKNGELPEGAFPKEFSGRCVKLSDISQGCKSFFEIIKINSVWKNKLSENTNAFKQQFLEMSKIICELKKNISQNRYFEAELSSELYSALTNEGFLVRDASVIRGSDDNYMVKLSIKPCKQNESCFLHIKEIIEDILGVNVSRVDGGCSEVMCSFVFKEGNLGGIEKRVHSISKTDSDPAGDSYIITEISQNKYLIALCDGMGSGKKASIISKSVISLLDEMLKAGFSEESAHKMINSFLIANLSGEIFTTIDFIVLDTKKMTGKILKNGACPTFIKRADGEITEIRNQSLPVGLTEQKPFIKNIHFKENDIIIMVSDGAMDSVSEKDWINKILLKLPSGELSEAVDLICGIAQRDFENREDDITVIGVKIVLH